MITISIISLFPNIFEEYLTTGMLMKATKQGLVQFNLINLRDFGLGQHKQVDDTPYGGGGGMILRIEPLVAAIEQVQTQNSQQAKVVLITPRGKLFNQAQACHLSELKSDLIFIGGRYEGYDERLTNWVDYQISLGQFVVTGFELPALIVVDATVRLLSGVLGNACAPANDSFSQGSNLVEHPQYTKPASFKGHDVPDVLLSGHHGQIQAWRDQQTTQFKI